MLLILFLAIFLLISIVLYFFAKHILYDNQLKHTKYNFVLNTQLEKNREIVNQKNSKF